MKFFLLHVALFPILVYGKNNPATGLRDSIKCKENQEILYAIYIPESYKRETMLPMVFFFEPAARATLPLVNYKNIADSLNIILACSYNSRNGPIKPNLKAAQASIKDIINTYEVDSDKIILSGFSGGSRTAYNYANFSGMNYGVIGCGAGLPSRLKNPIPPPFRYALIVGNLDFNFAESLRILDAFKEAQADIFYITFSGAHSWPPENEFKRALLYQLTGKTKKEFYRTLLEEESNAAKLQKEQTNLIAYKWSLENIQLLEKISGENNVYSDSINALIKSKDFKKQFRQFEKYRELEDSLIFELINAALAIERTSYNIYTNHKPISWWQKKIDYFKKLRASDNVHKSNLGKRLLGQIGVQLWERNRNMVELELYNQSLEMAEILLYLYPEAGSYHALKAESLAGQGLNAEALESYKTALTKDFDLENNPFLNQSKILHKLHDSYIDN